MSPESSKPALINIRFLPARTGGGKAAGLSRLAAIGLAVPPALVVIDADPGNLPDGITDAWNAHGGGLAAVRSSGADEDAEGASAAGQYETFLNVEPENLTQAVGRCLKSADADRAASYERQLSGQAGGAMSVVIQKMVNPSRAGVIFTADPMSGDRSVMVVEAVKGLGEDLVSGHARAARYVLNNLPDKGGSILKEAADDSEASDSAPLDDKLLESLRAGAALAEADWGVPLDLEWAVDGESGELYWLQARPITALADSLDSHVADDELMTRCNIGEMMPGAVTPLTLSTFGRSLGTGLELYYRSFGALGRREKSPSFIESFEDQLFMNLSSMYIMSRRVLGATAEGTELSILGYVLPPHEIGPMSPYPLRLLNGIRYFIGLFRWKSRVRALEHLAKGFAFRTDGKNAAEIVAEIKEAHPKVMDRAVCLHYGASAFSGAMNAALAMTLSGGSDVTDDARRLMTNLLSGVEGVESAAVLDDLENLAKLIKADGDAADLLEGVSVDAIHEGLLTDRSAVGEAYRAFMERHGHRCIREAELREPEWAVNPRHLIESLKSLVRSPAGRRMPKPVPNTRVATASPELPPGVNAKAVAWIAKQCRTGVRAREKSKSLLILAIHRFKTAARTLAARLEAEGYLPEADLAYFLTLEELDRLTGGQGGGQSDGLIGRAIRRRRRYPERMELRFPDLSHGRPSPEEIPVPEGKTALNGTPVSRGIAEGSVRVVKCMADAEALEDGEVMVAQFTDIGWSPFYGKAAGMITEIGGALSHGSVVAREYGLPLVGGLSGACRVLRTGMRVRLDGGTGSVVILDGEREEEPAPV
ncbi:MAG: PEP/pyruvate-binding domain-containing protein [Spirochaetaceae bacterium]|nr:PEP/pyruvate-binding domain-containing protein [Spirochaetaceae bacterium]